MPDEQPPPEDPPQPEQPAPPPQAFNPLSEWLVRDTVTDKVYQPVGLRVPETGQHYWLRVMGENGVLEFAPNYIPNIVWLRKLPEQPAKQ